MLIDVVPPVPSLTPEQLLVLLAFNLPIVAVILWANWKGYIDLNAKKTEREHDEESTFREQLRQEALDDKRQLEAKNLELSGSIKELTNVVRSTLDFNGELLEEVKQRGTDGDISRAIAPGRRTPRRTQKNRTGTTNFG